LNGQARSEWVRLRTLIYLRWLAIAGQSGALMFASFQLGLVLNPRLSVTAITASIALNVILTIIYPKNKLMSEREATLTLGFDLVQLVFLLYLTGGLNNPFSLLILVPVTISATALRLRSTLMISLLAIVLISILVNFHEPLLMKSGDILQMPRIFITGFWAALVIGVIFLGGYAQRITLETQSMSEALIATQMALSREQKLTDLGGVVAAAAHELGTPLATIKLVSSELVDELEGHKDLQEDVLLIRQQADRCRDILRDMGRTGKDDILLRHAPVSAIIREAAEPHEHRGKHLHFTANPKDGALRRQPNVRRQPEIIHGLRNLVQNAVDFAVGNVWIDLWWNQDVIAVSVSDDGAGYPSDMIGRIGDPFVRKRLHDTESQQRPEYEGMGLGLFIAKTLLERTGADLTFVNGSDPFLNSDEMPTRSGAIVEVIWPRKLIEQDHDQEHGPLGENEPLKI